jgi:hypothetical protein
MKTKNSSNIILLILVIIIILSIIYLYLKNKNVNKEIDNVNKEIEGFDYNLVPQSTQQSLSVYDINPTDSNTRGINYDNTKFNSTGTIQESRTSGWNGYWISGNLYMSILQINDLLLLSVNTINVSSTAPYEKIIQNTNGTLTGTTSVKPSGTFTTGLNCPLNNFTAVCQLNFVRIKFYIKNNSNIYCNTLSTFNNTLTGYISGNTINVNYTVNGKKETIVFNKDTKMNNSYINNSSKYSIEETKLINPYPQIPASQLSYNSTSFENKNTFMPINILSQYITNDNNNSYKLCSLINNINSNNKISAYIFCIDNFINVQSLDYNFWGVRKNESNLALKNTNSAYLLSLKLKSYINGNNINSDSVSNYAQQISSYMYCGSPQSTNFMQETSDLKTSFNNNKSNSSLNKNTPVVPIVWNISSSYKSSTCYISLSSVSDKNNTEKYATFNGDGSVNMSINKGGVNQELIFEDISTIKNEPNYFISTGYFRTNDLLYLVSNSSTKTIKGDNTVNLVSKPSPNGKWVIVGFNDKVKFNDIINNITP